MVVDAAPDTAVLQRWARMVGAHQEARRVRAARVGTEHLLMATYADPEVRRRMADIGADMRDVQLRVGTPASLAGTVGRRRTAPAGVALSAGAARVLGALLTRVGNDPGLARRANPDRDRDPRAMSAVLRYLLVGLVCDPGTGAARRILDDLTDGHTDPTSRRGATLIAELLGDPRGSERGHGVPLSRPDPD